MANDGVKSSKIPLNVSVNCDPIAENVWPFTEDDSGDSIADQQLIANTGYNFDGGVGTLGQVQTHNGNSPLYSYVTENGNIIDIRPNGTDPVSDEPMNGVYLDGKFLDNVPSHGLESMQAIGGNYDDLCLTDANPIAMKVKSNSTVGTVVYGTGGSTWTSGGGVTGPTVGVFAGEWASGLLVINLGPTFSTSQYSTNGGTTWSSIPSSSSSTVLCKAHGVGVYVVACGSRVVNRSDRPTTSWTTVANAYPSTFTPISMAYGNGRFMMVGSTNTGMATNLAYYSTDGITWVATTLPSSQTWKSVAFDGSNFMITSQSATAALGDIGGWSTVALPSSATWSFVTSISLGNFCAIAGTSVAYTSNSGGSWSTSTIPVAPNDVAAGNGVIVATRTGSSTSYRSVNNGATWSTATLPAVSTWFVCYNGSGFTATRSSNTAAISSPTIAPQLVVSVDEIDPSGLVVNTATYTIPDAGYSKPVALIKQCLGNGHSWARVKYFLAADSSTTYNIFDQSGAKILLTSIPATWAGGTPKYIWGCKFVGANFFICALGAAGTPANPSAYMITSSGGAAPLVNTNTGTTHSWVVMQSNFGFNRVIATGQYNTGATTANLINILGHATFTSSFTGSTIPTNTVTNTADLAAQPAASSYCYVDVVHTDYQHYYSGYTSPATSTSLFTNTATSSGFINGFGRLSFANTADFGGKNPFEFRLNIYKSYDIGSTAYPGAPQFISVGSAYGDDGRCAIGVPLSTVGEFDPSFGPQISGEWHSVCWRWNQVYYIAKVGTAPIRPIQKITANLYKINTISPINVVNVASRSLVLGSNDYTSSFLISGGTTAATSFGSANIAWSNQSQTAANSIDLGGVAFFNSGPYTTTPMGAFLPTCHQSLNYYFLNFYSGTVSSPATITLNSVWKANGDLVTGTSLLPGFQNQLSALGTTYIANTTLLPIPLGVRYQGYTVGTNSSATSSAFIETFITAGYQGTTLTSEWDGYILGNQLQMNAVSFALFNVPYLFDGRYIHRLTINNGGVVVPITTMARADGLVYMTTSSNVAFFYDSFDNSVWAFDGGATLSKIKRLDGFGAIKNGNFSPYENTLLVNTDTAIVTMRDGIWSALPKSALMAPDGGESALRLYDTTDGTVFGNTFDWWRLEYYDKTPVGVTTPISGFVQTASNVPFNFQTGYIGPDSNRRMILSAVIIEIYNEDRSQTDLTFTLSGYDQSGVVSTQPVRVTIKPSQFALGGVYRHRIQPKSDRILAASLQIQSAQRVRIFGLTYQWKPDTNAIYDGARSS